MITRALLIALCCAFAAAGTPLSAVGDDNDCALYLSGPGRTSAYDYSINLLKGNFGYEGQHTCITYDAVNQAYLEARNRIVVAQPKGDWKPEDYASVGELLLDISITLARMYGLTYEEIEKGLPLIDTSRTLIREVCPPIFSHVECRAGKYRRFDGLCTNLEHPTWGATMSPFQRLIGPLFSDGINAPRISHTGRDLPLSRVVSRTMHPDEGFHDHAGTVMVIAWGQFMDHDYTLTGTPLDPINRNDPEECCKRPPHLKHPYCNEIRIPDDDYFYRLFGVKCIDFVRGFPSPRPGCRLGSRVPFNTLTGVLDGNTVYGVTEKFARKLRTGYGGLLRMNPVFKEYGLKDLLPLKLDIPDEGCTRPDKNMYCFEAGEIRVNEQLVLTVMHTLMAREHNRVARGLAEVNPHWDDETLFQEARRINIAEIQYITYNEFLPILLGKDVMEKFGLVLEKDGYWDGYDPQVNPDVIDSFAAAAYRFGHSLLPTAVERWSKAHKFIASKRLSDLIRRPYDLYRAGVLDEYVMGLMNQVAQAMDDSITQEVTNHLFKKVGSRFGMDLVSFNMQRGREFGLPGYMEFRKFCGLSGADSFQDLFGSMPNSTVHKYETIFEHPIDVDLWSGGVSERPLPGSMLGPTFACIIATQFSYSRRGDRFWFELPNQPSSFTPEQLKELRKARLARVICDNTDIIDTVQLYPMVLPDHELNPRVPCRSGIIPSIDFTKWAEPAPFHGPAKQFMTDASAVKLNGNDTDPTGENIENTTAVHSNNVTTDTHQNFNYNESVKSDLDHQQIPNGIIHQANDTDIQACAQDAATINKCEEKPKLGNEIKNEVKNNDTVLKYVYKKNDKLDLTQKGAGHPKNSLKRKKRSVSDENSSKDTNEAESNRAPLIIDYKTSHNPSHADLTSSLLEHSTSNIKRNSNYEPRHIELVDPLQERTTGNVIKNANLADFNIETLHEKTALPLRSNENRKQNSDVELISNKHPQQRSKESEESNEKYPYRNNRRSYEESDENVERDNYRGIKKDYRNGYNRENHSSKDSEEVNDRNTAPYRTDTASKSKKHNTPSSLESYESNEKDNNQNKKRTYSDESQESYERERKDYNRNDKVIYPKPVSSSSVSEESDENYKKNKDSKESNESGNVEPSKYTKSRVDSQESVEKESEYIKSSPKSYPDKYGTGSKQINHEDNPRHLGSSVLESEYIKSSPKSYPDKYGTGSKQINHEDNPRHLGSSVLESEYIKSSPKSYPDKYGTGSKQIKHEDNPRHLGSSVLESEYIKSSPKSYPDKYVTGNKQINHEDNPKHLGQSNENSNESYEKNPKLKEPLHNHKYENKEYLSKVKPPIQDVDLEDFSYEKIQINDKGQVVPTNDSLEKLDTISSKEITISSTLKPKTASEESQEKLSNIKDIDTSSNIGSNEDSQDLKKVNVGEIRPVVEINPENNSDELAESGHSKEPFNESLDTKDKSLEAVLGVKQLYDSDQNEKLQHVKEEGKGDVKQQFERIPLTYKHDDIKHKPDKDNTQTEKSINTEHEEIPQNEGTLDTLLTKSPQYDENLKFKFDDVTVTLPEIKLPDDILAYTYDSSPYQKHKKEKNTGPKFYHYGNENNDEEKDKKAAIHNDEDEEDIGYDSYYGNYKDKDNYKKQPQQEDEEEEEEEEEEDNVDLYEKFVRERFGKRGTFAQRSENLEDRRPVKDNPQLQDRIQNILKKTQDVEKQAEKSGDPNAGYMWTLEYGQNL